MKLGLFTTPFRYFMIGLVLMAGGPGRALAQNGHSHTMTAQQQQLTPSQGELLKVVREATARFKDVSVAEAEGYSPLFGCVTGPDFGAMGLHYVNMGLLGTYNTTGAIDATHPDVLVYEPMPDGHLQLLGADYLVFADQWDQAHPGQGAPQVMGQLFDQIDSPNRFGLPRVYTLHVWAWKQNPNGAFVLWHPNVSCQAFSGQ
jgi:hypothetical protein